MLPWCLLLWLLNKWHTIKSSLRLIWVSGVYRLHLRMRDRHMYLSNDNFRCSSWWKILQHDKLNIYVVSLLWFKLFQYFDGLTNTYPKPIFIFPASRQWQNQQQSYPIPICLVNSIKSLLERRCVYIISGWVIWMLCKTTSANGDWALKCLNVFLGDHAVQHHDSISLITEFITIQLHEAPCINHLYYCRIENETNWPATYS